MIGFLRGTLVDRSTRGEVLVDVNGVGYRVTVNGPTLARAGELGSLVTLYVHTHVREDALVLYGFVTREERACFELLLGAHGVGPALALAVLGVHTPVALQTAVLADDADALTMVPGVGKKTAARLLLDLKSRLDVLDLGSADVVVASAGGRADTADGPAPADAKADVRAALAGLGYAPDEVRAVLRKLPPGDDATALLRQALAILSGAPA